MALINQPYYWWLILILLGGALITIRRRTQPTWTPAVWMRMLLIAVVIFQVANLSKNPFSLSNTTEQILLLDRSDSIPIAARARLTILAKEWLREGSARQVILFGEGVSPVASTELGWVEPGGEASDLAAALNATRQSFVSGKGVIVLASDGKFSRTQDIESILGRMETQGVKLNGIALAPLIYRDDLYIEKVLVPEIAWRGTPISVIVSVVSPGVFEGQVRLLADGDEIETYQGTFTHGINIIQFKLAFPEAGLKSLRVEAMILTDDNPANNINYSAVEVVEKPRVMIVSDDLFSARGFARTLRATGIQVDLFSPSDVPTVQSGYHLYNVVVLQNIIARELDPEQQLGLSQFVEKTGGGLIFLGGRNSYTLGGYQDSSIGNLMPVKMEPSSRAERAPVTFLLILDRSASMAGEPIALVREAAMRTLETMHPKDYVGVLTYSGDPVWDVPLRLLGDGLKLREAQDAISQIKPGGGTLMYRALEEGINQIIEKSSTETLHVLLMSDAVSYDGTNTEFQDLAAYASRNGVTISTILLGVESNQGIMTDIAEIGKGRFYEVASPVDLPEIMISESKAARSENVQEGETGLTSNLASHYILAGFSLDQFPTIDGYNAISTRKELGSEDILVSQSFGDPILSAQRYGRGRVITWTSDIGKEWAKDWLSWDGAEVFWGKVVQYAVVHPAGERDNFSIRQAGRDIYIELIVESREGIPQNHLSPVFQYEQDGENIFQVILEQDAPGQYVARIEKPAPGAYKAAIQYGQGAEMKSFLAPVVVNYPVEWKPLPEGEGIAQLGEWASKTGGTLLVEEEFFGFQSSDEQDRESDQPFPLGLALLVILWPLEIALRRRYMPWK